MNKKLYSSALALAEIMAISSGENLYDIPKRKTVASSVMSKGMKCKDCYKFQTCKSGAKENYPACSQFIFK